MNVQSLHQAASAHLQAGRTQQAVDLLLQIANSYPNEPRCRFVLGFIAHRAGEFAQALDWLNQSIRIDPTAAEPYFLSGLILQQQKQLPQAIDAYQKYLSRKPGDARALANLARALLETGEVKQALGMLQQLLAMDPKNADAHGSMGIALAKQGKLAESAASLQRAITIDPKSYSARFNLARVFQDSHQIDEALQQCKLAIELRPDSPDAHNLLGNLLGITGQIPECIAAQRRAVQLRPAFAGAHSNLLLSLNYLPDLSPADLFAAHLQWAAQHANLASVFYRDYRNTDRRLRVGYVSPNFNTHSVAFFFEPVLAEHDRQVVEVFCYSDVKVGDAATERLRGLAEHWREIAGKSDVEVLKMIRADGIDILVDLAGHTAGNRLPLFAHRPAAVQMTWIGYPATTGMTAMDYRLTDPIADPPGLSDTLHTEKLLRIEGGCWAYQAPTSPAIGPFPAISNGFVTYGSFNNLPKVTPKVIESWARILHCVPGSRMLIKSAGLGSRLGREHVQSHFTQRGISSDRVELISWTASTEAHLKLYDRIDIALDTFPYNGTTTTCEALWMGVPVVTFPGATHVSRVGAALLTHAGHCEWIADDVDSYIALAVRLAGELKELTDVRKGLRDRLRESPLCDARRLARQLESLFREAIDSA